MKKLVIFKSFGLPEKSNSFDAPDSLAAGKHLKNFNIEDSLNAY